MEIFTGNLRFYTFLVQCSCAR
ncbi:hypothetical protein LINPERHAP1_LOCUS14783 [Linum perenne]